MTLYKYKFMTLHITCPLQLLQVDFNDVVSLFVFVQRFRNVHYRMKHCFRRDVLHFVHLPKHFNACDEDTGCCRRTVVEGVQHTSYRPPIGRYKKSKKNLENLNK